ncbi:phage minor head protein [Henriciella sp.]|uniref:phage minor head protein n=1 Tax=Henriciella sp. TaxID=1968823 RepID=UPI00263659FA|nr:phage minor head protein [Henriciella sp.]
MSFDLAELARQEGLRKNRVLRGIEITDTLKRDLYRIVVRPVRAWERQVIDRIRPAYGQAMSTLTRDDESDDLAEAIRIAEAQAAGATVTVDAEVRGWVLDALKWHEQRWADAVKAGTGIDVFPFIDRKENAARVKAFQSQIANLVKDVDAKTKKEIADTVWRGFAEGKPRKKIAKELTERIGIARRRANTIAVDQAQKLNGELTRIRMSEAGVQHYRWRHSQKRRFRPAHKAREGRIYKLGEPLGDEPGIAIYCFPSGQPVSIHDDVLKIWRRWHSGHLTEFVTEAGERVSCTANHPILTNTGWKPAEALNVGDYIAQPSFSSLHAGDVYIEQREPTIGEVFAAGQTILGAVSVNVRPGDFHGDVIADENIDVVDADGGLRREITACISQGVSERVFEHAHATLIGLKRAGALKTLPHWSLSARDSRVRSLRLLEALFWRHLIPDDAPGLSRASDWYAIALEHVGDGLALGAEAIAERFDGLARKVGPDRFRLIVLYAVTRAAAETADPISAPGSEVLGQAIGMEPDHGANRLESFAGVELRYSKVEVCVSRAWEGHVYNFQTASGWYIAGTAGVGNCGCVSEPVVDVENNNGATEGQVAEADAPATAPVDPLPEKHPMKGKGGEGLGGASAEIAEAEALESVVANLSTISPGIVRKARDGNENALNGIGLKMTTVTNKRRPFMGTRGFDKHIQDYAAATTRAGRIDALVYLLHSLKAEARRFSGLYSTYYEDDFIPPLPPLP